MESTSDQRLGSSSGTIFESNMSCDQYAYTPDNDLQVSSSSAAVERRFKTPPGEFLFIIEI